MTAFHWALIALFSFGLLVFIATRYLAKATDKTETLKRAKLLAVMTLVGATIGLIGVFHSADNWQKHLDSQYAQISAKSDGHAFAIAVFKACLKRPYSHATKTASSSPESCKITTYHKVNALVYKSQWVEIRNDLNTFISQNLD